MATQCLRSRVIAVVVAVVVAAAGLVGVTRPGGPVGAAEGDPATSLVSVGWDGTVGNAISSVNSAPSVSEDGRFVAFQSAAWNLVEGDTPWLGQVWVRDRELGTNELISVGFDGAKSDNPADQPSISADGRFVAFRSAATNLVEGSGSSVPHIFVRDRQTATTTLVSVDSGGDPGNLGSERPAISSDGRFVAFQSIASNLVPGDTNLTQDVFVHDRVTGTTERASVADDGSQSAVFSASASISGDGRFVSFHSIASNLVPGDTNNAQDVFVRDRVAGTTERVSVGSAGVQGNFASLEASISANGRFVAFRSGADNLVVGDTNFRTDVFVRDREAGTTELVSRAWGGGLSTGDSFSFTAGSAISADGRYVVFQSFGNDLVPDDTNGWGDVFVRDRHFGTTERVSIAADGSQIPPGSSAGSPAISPDGRYAAFVTAASTVVPDDTNNVDDVFLRDRGEPPVQLVALEVNQGVQNWRNTVPLVRARPTTVRAFVQTAPGEDPKTVTGRLTGRRAGVELPASPLSASNAGASVIASSGIAERRGQLGASLNFELPASWRSGTVELTFSVSTGRLVCSEAAGPAANDCRTTVTFGAGADATLRVVGVEYADAGTTFLPTPADLRETGHRVRSALPASSTTVSIQDRLATGFTEPPELGDVNAALALQRTLDSCTTTAGCPRLYYGHLAGSHGGGLAAGIPGDVSSGWDLGVTGRESAGYWRNVAPHEVGHSLGVSHAVRGPVVEEDGKSVKKGVCGEVAGAGVADFPYFGEVGGAERSLMGPATAGAHDQIWGLDTRFVTNDVNNLAVIPPVGPRATFELMGYCWIAAPQDLWSSDHTWNRLRDGLEARFGATAMAMTTTAASGSRLAIAGVVDVDAGTARIDPPALVDVDAAAPRPGDYTLRVTDAAGMVLDEVSFDPDDDLGRPMSQDGSDPEPNGVFLVSVPVPEVPIGRIVVLREGVEIGALEGGGGPSVVPTSPAAGSVQGGASVEFSWVGSPGARYHVRYSPDGGDTWTTVAVGITDTQVEVARRQLPGSTGGVFEVQAVDGASVTTVVSEPFTVTNNAPEVEILAPTVGGNTYSDEQQIVTEATATDAEDGDVSPSIVWSSNRDGELLVGPDGVIQVSEMSEGTHVLTASATDGDGLVGASSVTVQVGEVVEPETVTYTARYDAQRCAAIEAWSAGLGVTPAEMIRLGVDGFRGVAEQHPGTTYAELSGSTDPRPPLPPEDVACEFEVVWDTQEQAALEAAAAWWGVSGDQLHDGGGWLVVVLIYRALVGLPDPGPPWNF